MPLAPNTRLGPYEILAPLGAGGMGEVYRARDTRLDRDVAVKVLPEQTARDPAALARFEREAKAVAALSHPNILSVYDVGRHEDISYVVMELLEGETVRQRINRSALPARKAVDVGIAIADGLSAAHTRGVIHRDLKPENVFLTADGHVKILDFGLARSTGPVTHDLASSPTLTIETRPGAIIGTLCYMAPEQIRAQVTDARTDIFAFGCVMYEMLTGKRAFLGETAADTMTAILKDEPKSVRTISTAVAPELERLIDRCIEKRPEQRFQSASDLAFSLRTMHSQTGVAAAHTGSGASRFTRVGVAMVVVAALAIGAFAVLRELRNKSPDARPTIDSIAVLPLENVSRDPEQEYFVDGMTEALISDLAKIGGLKVISRTSVMRYKATTKSLPDIAKELKVDAVVEGSVQRAGDRVRITAQLIHAATDEHLWTESYDRDLSDVLRLQSEVARTIAQEIKVKLTPQEQDRIAAARPINPAAHEAYLKGRFYWNKRTPDGLRKAVEYFEQAIALAPDWPLGYAGLADAYLLMPWYSNMRPSEANPKARTAAAKALEMDESLAEAHATMGIIAADYDRDWPTAEREFRRALALSPNYATAHQWYGLQLRFRGRHAEAMSEATKAQELDPLSLIIGVNVGEMYYDVGNLEQAETQFRKTLEFAPDFTEAHIWLVRTLFLQSRSEEAITQAREAVRISNNDPRCASTLGYVYAKSGQPEEARRILDEITTRSKEVYVPPTHLAFVHAGLEERDRMFVWLERAYQEHDVRLLDTLIDPLLADMRSDPRFVDLVRRVGIPPLAPMPAATSLLPNLPRADKGGLPGGKTTLAVLPFINDSGDKELDYLGDGIAETLINGFSRVEAMNMVPRSLAFKHKGAADPVRAGRDLSATAVLSGRILKRGDNLTVQADLVDVGEGRQLWGERYPRKFDDLVQIERDIAADIADALRLRLTGEEKRKLSRGYSENAEAYRHYLEGRFWWAKRTKEGFDNALRLLNRAVELDPSFALAHTGTADCYSLMPLYGLMRTADALPKARAAAEAALRLDDDLAEAHASMGMVHFYLEWDLKAAEAAFRRAMNLNARHATAHQWYGLLAAAQGRMSEGRRELRRAIELDPLMPIFHHNLGWIEYWEGNYEEALAVTEGGLQFAPEFPWLQLGAGLTLLELGRPDEAIVHLRKGRELAGPASFATAQLGYGLARTGHTEEARAILDESLRVAIRRYVPPTDFATICVGLGEHDEAIRWLEEAYEVRDSWLLFMGTLRVFAPLRGDPRFADLLRRIGLPPSATTTGDAPAREQPGARGARGEKIMLAVLPFENLSRDPDQEYFSDGLTEEMITQLGRINPQRLGVIARSSAMHYKNTDRTISNIKSELGVDYVVEGSVLRHDQEIRITARLVETVSQSQIWADSFAPEVENLLAWQSTVTKEIARQIKITLAPQEQARTVNPDAYQAYLKGRFHWNKRTSDGLEKAVEFFEQAIALDPAWPLAYAGLADAYLLMPDYSPVRPSEAIPKARAAAAKALEMDESLGEAHTTMASIATNYDWDWPTAEREYQRALALTPNYATAHQWYAEYLLLLGRYREAIPEFTKAQELDPVSVVIGTNTGFAHYLAGDLEQAETQLRKTLELNPDFAGAHGYLATTLFLQGRLAEATTEAREAVRLSNNFPYHAAVLGYIFGKVGQAEEARKILDELAARSTDTYVTPTHFALVHAGLDERDRMFEWLGKACQEHDPFLVYNLPEPLLAPMRSDLRFADVVRCVGLPPRATPGATGASP